MFWRSCLDTHGAIILALAVAVLFLLIHVRSITAEMRRANSRQHCQSEWMYDLAMHAIAKLSWRHESLQPTAPTLRPASFNPQDLRTIEKVTVSAPRGQKFRMKTIGGEYIDVELLEVVGDKIKAQKVGTMQQFCFPIDRVHPSDKARVAGMLKNQPGPNRWAGGGDEPVKQQPKPGPATEPEKPKEAKEAPNENHGS